MRERESSYTRPFRLDRTKELERPYLPCILQGSGQGLGRDWVLLRRRKRDGMKETRKKKLEVREKRISIPFRLGRRARLGRVLCKQRGTAVQKEEKKKKRKF